MDIQYELEEPFRYSWDIVYALLVVIAILIIGYLLIKFSPFFSKHFGKFFKKAQAPSYKAKALKLLGKLREDVENNNINNRDAYLKLSNIIRKFIEKTTGINVLSLSKEEVKKLDMEQLSILMEEYYPPEFAKESHGNILDSIDRTTEVIKRWN